MIYGRNFQTRSARNQEWTVVPFLLDGERMCVQVCIAPNPDGGQRAMRPGFPIPHVLEYLADGCNCNRATETNHGNDLSDSAG